MADREVAPGWWLVTYDSGHWPPFLKDAASGDYDFSAEVSAADVLCVSDDRSYGESGSGEVRIPMAAMTELLSAYAAWKKDRPDASRVDPTPTRGGTP